MGAAPITDDSGHCSLRWLERSGELSHIAEEAWDQGTPVEPAGRSDGDEYRYVYVPDWEMRPVVLVRVGGTLKTTLIAERCQLAFPAETHLECDDCGLRRDGTDSWPTNDPCFWCDSQRWQVITND